MGKLTLTGAGPFTGGLLAAAFYRLLKVLHYERANGDQDKSADEEAVEPLIADQTQKIEKYLRLWGPRAWRNSKAPGSEAWPLTSPERAQGAPQLRLYRMSGLEAYKSHEDLNRKEPERRSPSSLSRFDDSSTVYDEERQSPRRW